MAFLLKTTCRVYKMPIGVSDRDVVQYMKKGKDEDKKLQYVIYKDAIDERKPEVPKVKVVRYM